VPIAIIGETGTGKELLARAIHGASGREGPFVPVNCAALTPSLVEAQLFGYAKGAYSGSGAGNQGFVRAADGGTLFLDEIMDLPLEDQAKLLRVLQEREVVPVGMSKAVKVNVRFLAASQKPLADLVATGRFREDLEKRLERRILRLPTLSERRADLGLLVAALLRRADLDGSDRLVLPAEAVNRILSYRWPGNIRELENKLGEAVDRSMNGVLDPAVFPKAPAAADRPQAGGAPVGVRAKAGRDLLVQLLQKHGGNVSAVARDLGKHREPVYRLLEKAGLDPMGYRVR